MSTINDIMAELQAGQSAREQVPELSRRIALLENEIDKLGQHNQALELKGRDREDTINTLTQKVRSLEVERDDAGFRELEAQDRFTTLLESVRPIWSSLGRAIDRANPPEPVKVPEPVKEEPKAEQSQGNATGQSDPRPSEPVSQAAQSASPASPSGAANVSEPWKPSVEMPEVKPEGAQSDEWKPPSAASEWWNKPHR